MLNFSRASHWCSRFFATSTRPNENSKGYLHSLDGWRALAIILVVLDHSKPFSHLMRHLQVWGRIGVEIFFAISGFLICSRLLAEESKFGKISLSSFYLRRGFRILPASLLYLSVIALLGAASIIPFERSSWLSALLFYRNYYSYFFGDSAAGWFTAHFWSLSIEEHFYFLLPSILLFFPTMRRWILILLIVMSLGCTYLYSTTSAGHFSHSYDMFSSQRTEFCLVGLLVPAFFAIAVTNPKLRARFERFLPAWLGCLLGMICTTRCMHPFSHVAWNNVWGFALTSSLFPLMLISTILHPASLVTRVLEFAPLRFIGRISYSVYLWQTLFLTRSATYSRYPIHVLLQHPALDVFCTFVCAITSYYFVEKPFIAYSHRLVKSRQKKSAALITLLPTS